MMSTLQSIASPTAMLYWLNLAVVVTLLGGVSLVLVKIFRNRSEVFRHAFVVVSLLVLLVTPIAVWVGSHSQLGLLTIKDAHLVGSSSVHPLGAPWELPFPWEEFEGGPTFNDQNAVASEMVSSADHESTSPPPLLGTDILWRQVGFGLLLMTWCCGTVWFILQTIRGGLLIRKYLRLSTPVTEESILTASKSAAQKVGLAKVPSIIKSELVPVPLSTGVCYPAVILPEGFIRDANREALEAVLIHEFAYIVRRDHWVGLIQRLTVAIFWWNPLVYRISRLCSSLAEEICDDYVAKSLKSGEGFARLLVAMAERVVDRVDMPLAIGILPTRRHDLERRITRLMQKERKMKTRLSLNHVALVSLFAFLMLGTSVLSTAWAESRVDIPVHNSGNETVAESELDGDATGSNEKTNSLDGTSIEHRAPIDGSFEVSGATSTVAKGDTVPANSQTRSQGTLRLIKDTEVSRHGAVRDKSLSPNGLKIVYGTDDPDMIIVMDLSTGVEREYEQSSDSFSPVWSPDGKRVAFLDGKTGTEWKDQTVGILTLDSGDVKKTDIQGIPCDWSGDGRFLLVLGEGEENEGLGLRLVDLTTGETQASLGHDKWGWYPEMPRLSPDGKYIVYHARHEGTFVQKIMGSDEPMRITPDETSGCYPLWSADGKQILFTTKGL